jgi:protein-S-isoprenylcysteine O-methyltransferase Ste14
VGWHAYPFIAGWTLWLLYWRISAGHVKRTQWHESVASRTSHLVPVLLGAWLLVVPAHGWGALQVTPQTPALYGAGVALLAAGLGFSCWARAILGLNWSATVTLKSGHELVHTGPYHWVRHPIYTGLLTAILGGVLAQGTLQGWIAVALMTAGFVRKLRIEERVLCQQFPLEYPRYRAQVAALIPGIY